MVRAAALLEVLGEDTPSLGGWGEDRCSITVCRWDPLAGCISLRPGDIQVFRFASCSSPSPLGPALEPEVPSEAEGGPEPAGGADVPDGTVTVREVRAAVAGAWALPDPSALALVALTGAQAAAQLPEDVQTLQMCGVVPGDILIAEVKASDEASGPCGSPGAALGSVALYDQVASGTHVEEVWELQRRYTVLSASWRAPFMPHDGPAKLRWVCREGYGQHPWMADSKEQPAAQPTPPLVPPEGYFGCGWAVVEPPGDCDRDGWQYAFDFYEEDDAWRAEAGLYLCRRRLWRCTFVR
ncbi:unnamed protein product [Prorocentrum cordatum]|uniref:Peroxin/Ferlin domain-containing protein n=1 Tax=Prorocentrum cordatum TaxID=2364126 RepID=A0ABN9WSJ8_9DINO|nr:unnamed protein product [Polarella glacialis]